jgi:TolB-like protein/two-component SAPR family response regulator
MAWLSLRIFGEIALHTAEGAEIPIRLVKERALLVYLALHPGKKLTRSHLSGLLWGGQSDAKARHSLSQALSSLNRRIGLTEPIIERYHNEIVLREDAISTDVAEFQSGADSNQAEEQRRAIELYDNQLLSDFDFEEPDFDDWAYSLRAECQQQITRAGLGYLSNPQEDEAGERIAIALQLLQVDPLAEPVHQALIRLYIETGQKSAAIKQFESCRDIFRRELDIDPGPETHRLVQQAQNTTITSVQGNPSENEDNLSREVPTLVVVPIENLSGDPDLQYLAHGVTDDITTELTRYRSLFVISHESSAALSNQSLDSSVLCRRFGVRHAIRGSIRHHGQGYRINLRLVDGDNGQNVWGERYDISTQELLELPVEVVEQTVGRLATWLEQETLVRAQRKATESWSAYDHILQGLCYHHKNWYGIYNTLRAIKHFERAVEIDPGCARAYAYLACAKSYPYFKDRKHDRLGPCTDLAQRAIELDPTEAEAHRVLGGIHLCRGEHDTSRIYFERAQQIHPGHSHILAHAARYHMHTGDPKTATSLMGKAQQLNPLHLPWYWEHLGIAAFVKGDYQGALEAFGRMQNHSFYDQLYVTAANAHLNRMRHAKNSLACVLENKPGLRRSKVSYLFPYRDQPDLDRVLNGLEIAGLR